MGFWAWVFIIIAAAVVIAIVQAVATGKRQQEMDSRLKSLPDFNPTQQVMGCDGKSGLAVDEPRKRICLIANHGTLVSHRILYYKDILSVELFEDGTSITKTVRSSQIGGAVVGGILLGGVGALVGGLSGKTETSGKVNRIDLRLIVNDTNAPLHDVAFMNVAGKKNGILYTQAIQEARRWHGIVEVLIKRADPEEKSLQNSEDYNNSRYNGVRNITSGKYQLFLTKKYAIEKNATLEKYVIDDNLFQTLEDALAFCDNKERHVERERLRKAYKIKDVRKNSNAELAGIEVGDILVAYNRRAIASNIDISDAIESASEPTTTLVVFRDEKPLILKVSAGVLGIDGSIEELDPPVYALRVRQTA